MRCVPNDRKLLVSASLSCADLLHLYDSIVQINASDIDFVHYDVVDGCFNNCFVFGDLILEKIRPICEKPIEVHLACLLYTSKLLRQIKPELISSSCFRQEHWA